MVIRQFPHHSVAQIGDVSSAPLPITVKKPWASITNKPSDDTLYKGSTHTLSYTTDPENAEIKWDSSNDSVAVINSQTGEISARADGQVIISITVKYGDFIDVTDTFSLSVNNQSIWVDGYGSTELIIGNTVTLTAEVGTYDGDDKTVIWETSDSNIATVNNGVVTTIGIGEVTITARLKKYPSVSWSVTFTVNLPSATNIKITNLPTNKIPDENKYILKDDTTHNLSVTITPTVLPGVTYEWLSGDSAVATVDSTGKITTLTEGNTTITVKAYINNKCIDTDSFALKVIHIDSVFIDGVPQYDLTVGETYNLTAKVYPYYSYVQGVTWSLDMNSTVNSNAYATLDANGKLTLKSEGFITVFARSKIDNTVYDYFHIDIHPKTKSIEITNLPEDNTLCVGETHQLGYIISPVDALVDVEWGSSDEFVANIDPQTGVITAKSIGVTTIFLLNNNIKEESFTLEVLPYTKVESNNKTFVGTLISDVPMIQSYNVTITLSYKVIAVNGNKAKIESISVYASYLKGAIQDGVDYPDIEIGSTTLAGDSLILVDNDGDEIYSPNIVFDDEIILLNRWAYFDDEITSLATIMLNASIYPERTIHITTMLQKR